MQINSPRNPLLQEIRRAAASGRPTEDGLVVAEGPHLLGEAKRGDWEIKHVLVTEISRFHVSALLSGMEANVIELSERAFEGTAITQTHQGVITLLRPRQYSWADIVGGNGLMVILDGIQDPGNAGTIIRSAEAFGASGAIFLRGCVHVANGKFLRAAAGSAFRLPLLENVAPENLVSEARRRGIRLYALTPAGQEDLTAVDLTRPGALVLGSEGAGISRLIGEAAMTVRIPVMTVESLNVGVAGSIALFEVARQRRSK